jgi:hypothetical protein
MNLCIRAREEGREREKKIPIEGEREGVLKPSKQECENIYETKKESGREQKEERV